MRMSSRGSDFRKFSAKLRTDFRLPRSSCMNTTWLLPLFCRKHGKLIKHITILQWPSTVMNELGITCTIMYILDDITGYLGQTWVFWLVKYLLTLLISSSAASPRCLLRQARITRAPLLARSKAVVFPIPVLLPAGEKTFYSAHQSRHGATQWPQNTAFAYQSQSQFSHVALLCLCISFLSLQSHGKNKQHL